MENQEEYQKQLCIAIAVLYEWIFVNHIGDESKRGYVYRKLNDGTIFGIIPSMIDEITDVCAEHRDKINEEEFQLVEIIRGSYEKNGASKIFAKDLTNAMFSNSTIKVALEENLVMKRILSAVTGE